MSDLNLQPSEDPQAQPGTEEGYGQMPVGMKKDDCKKKAEKEGGYIWDEHAQACWMLFGKAVTIGPTENSIEEFAKIFNFNFRANGTQPAVPTQDALPGPVNNAGAGSRTE